MLTPQPEDEIAQWMYEEFQRDGELIQSRAAQKISELYGEDYLYRNDNGNLAIKKPILDKFKKLRGNEAVWATQLQLWRRRKPDDPEGKTSVYY